MSLVRAVRAGAALTLLGAAGMVASGAAPAEAAIVPGSCVYGYNMSNNWETATCTDDNSSYWYLRIECDRFIDLPPIFVNGSIVYGPGRGTSHVQCPHNTELGPTTIVLVNY
jgi:hypothetical protein